MSNMHKKLIEQLWDDEQNASSEMFVRKVSAEEEQAVDDALDLQLISIRLQKKLIQDLKLLAKEEGISYQPFIRQILTRYVRSILR